MWGICKCKIKEDRGEETERDEVIRRESDKIAE
jgi:hypothetical protein